MTTRAIKGGYLISQTGPDSGMTEHSIVVQVYDDAISIQQDASDVIVTLSSLAELIKALRRIEKESAR